MGVEGRKGSPGLAPGQVVYRCGCANLTHLAHAVNILPQRDSRLAELVGVFTRWDLVARGKRRELAAREHKGMQHVSAGSLERSEGGRVSCRRA